MEAAALFERAVRELAAAGIRFASRLKRAMAYMRLHCAIKEAALTFGRRHCTDISNR